MKPYLSHQDEYVRLVNGKVTVLGEKCLNGIMKVSFDCMLFVLLLILQRLGHCPLYSVTVFVMLVFAFILLMWLDPCSQKREGLVLVCCKIRSMLNNGHYILIISCFFKIHPSINITLTKQMSEPFCFHVYTCRTRWNKFQIEIIHSKKFATLIIYASDKLPLHGITAIFLLNVEL